MAGPLPFCHRLNLGRVRGNASARDNVPQVTDLPFEKGTLLKFDLQAFPLKPTEDHLQSLQVLRDRR